MKYAILLLLLASNVVCAQPKWTLNIASDPSTFIGVGVGDSLANAKLDAKNQIASSIRSTHSFAISKVVNTTQLEGTSETSSISKSNSNNVLLPELMWPHIDRYNGVYYVMGKIRKNDLIALYERTLAITASEYSKQLVLNELTLQDYLKLLSGQEKIALAAERASIIYDDSSKGKEFHALFLSLNKKLNQHSNKSCIKIFYKGSSSFERKMFEPMVEQVLASSGITVDTLVSCEPVKINVNSDGSKVNGQRIDKIKLFVELGSPVIVSKTVTFGGRSSGSKKSSYSNAVDNFIQYFNENNPFMGYLLDTSKSTLVIN